MLTEAPLLVDADTLMRSSPTLWFRKIIRNIRRRIFWFAEWEKLTFPIFLLGTAKIALSSKKSH